MQTTAPTATKAATIRPGKAEQVSTMAKGTTIQKKKAKARKGKGKKVEKRMQAQKVRRGRIYVNLQIVGTQVKVDIEEGKDLMGVDKDDSSNPYVVVKMSPGQGFSPAEFKTKTITDDRRPKFHEKFTFDMPYQLNKDNTRVQIFVHHAGKGKLKAAFMGGMAFSVAEIEDRDTYTEGWFRLLDEKRAANQNEPFRVTRRQEMTTEQMEIYGVYDPSAGGECLYMSMSSCLCVSLSC